MAFFEKKDNKIRVLLVSETQEEQESPRNRLKKVN